MYVCAYVQMYVMPGTLYLSSQYLVLGTWHRVPNVPNAQNLFNALSNIHVFVTQSVVSKEGESLFNKQKTHAASVSAVGGP